MSPEQTAGKNVVRAPIDLSVIEDPQARHLIGRCLDRNIIPEQGGRC